MEEKIKRANERLRSAKLGVTIQQIGNRLYLSATLPPKPNSNRTKPYQQRISLKVYANGAGLQFAEKEARKLGDALGFGLFNWSDYLEEKPDTVLIKDLIKEFEKDYFDCRARTEKSEYTFKQDYLVVLKKLPQDQVLTQEILIKTLTSTTPETRTRKRYYVALNALAKFAKIEVDLSRYRGNYSAKSTKPRELPSDELIVKTFYSIKNPQWQWVFGMLATFGLRPHEVFHCDPNSRFPVLEVLKGKTDYRKVYPLYPEWVEQFDLHNFKLPKCTGSNTDLGHRVTVFFRRQKIPFVPYDLRHKWAIRAIEFGLDISLSARMMGHSVKVHTETYQRWLGDSVFQSAFEKIVDNPLRPIAPKVAVQQES